jgi:hypothetical protein
MVHPTIQAHSMPAMRVARTVLLVPAMRTPLLHAVTSTLLSIGCATSGQVQYRAQVTPPELVYINTEVQVIANYGEPIFYKDYYYWRYDGGVWYRSPRHTSGWVRIEVVPVAIRRIERPTAYIHYRGVARARSDHGPVIRDHRDPAPPAVRDQHDERKDLKEAQKDDRRELKDAQKDARKDEKDAQRDHKPGR